MSLHIPAPLARDLVDHAERDFPNECCGMIGGRDGVAEVVYRATNIEASPFMYVIDPREQLRIMDEIDDAGLDLLAIYHSHTRSVAYPSRTDVELAFFPQVHYLISSLAERETPDLRAFRIARTTPPEDGITEVPVVVND